MHPLSLRLLSFSALLLGSAALPAGANDTSVGGDGASFGPLEESRAAMRSEHIRIRLDDDGFHVHATYRLANLTDAPLALRIGFPEAVCDEEWQECRPGVHEAFEAMETTVRGLRVPPVVEATGQDSPWAEHYPRMWTFEVNFGPGEEVDVVHTYRVVPSIDSMGHVSMRYVVRTGANWAEPIGVAEFELDLPAGTCGAEVRGGHARFERQAVSGRWRGDWSRRDWVPTEDFGIEVVPWRACLMFFDCPMEVASEDTDERAAQVASLAESYPPEQLRVCRNLAWAVTGYDFSSEDLRERFYGGGTSPFSATLALSHGPDPHWGEGRLTPAMRGYARLLRDAEARQRQR
jgi:hypothetical protein